MFFPVTWSRYTCRSVSPWPTPVYPYSRVSSRAPRLASTRSILWSTPVVGSVNFYKNVCVVTNGVVAGLSILTIFVYESLVFAINADIAAPNPMPPARPNPPISNPSIDVNAVLAAVATLPAVVARLVTSVSPLPTSDTCVCNLPISVSIFSTFGVIYSVATFAASAVDFTVAVSVLSPCTIFSNISFATYSSSCSSSLSYMYWLIYSIWSGVNPLSMIKSTSSLSYLNRLPIMLTSYIFAASDELPEFDTPL